MTDKPITPTVGPEGLAISLAGLAAQVGAIERQAAISHAALVEVVKGNNADIREILSLHIAHIEKLDAERRRAHEALHAQEAGERVTALHALNARLDGFPKEYAGLAIVEGLNKRIDKESEDARRRFEDANLKTTEAVAALERQMIGRLDTIQKQITDGLASTQAAARADSRIGQDVQTSQEANARLVGAAGAVIGIIVALIALASRFIGGG